MQCGEMFGFGRCVSKLSDEVKDKFAEHLERLRRLNSPSKANTLQLFWMRSAEANRNMLLLRAFLLCGQNPVTVYLQCHGNPEVAFERWWWWW